MKRGMERAHVTDYLTGASPDNSRLVEDHFVWFWIL